MSTRRLSLHVSALSDDEYTQYTAILDDLAPDGDDLSVRETRAWLRGRYPDAPVDEILRLFSPTMRAADTMTRGQFYAAMRLLTHAQAQGNGVDKSLAFVQRTCHLQRHPRLVRSPFVQRSPRSRVRNRPVRRPVSRVDKHLDSRTDSLSGQFVQTQQSAGMSIVQSLE